MCHIARRNLNSSLSTEVQLPVMRASARESERGAQYEVPLFILVSST